MSQIQALPLVQPAPFARRLATLAGAAALCAISLWIGALVFATDDYAGHPASYLALALIALGAVALFEALFYCLGIHRGFSTPRNLILMACAGLLLAAAYGPAIFVKFYEYDDWIYIPYHYSPIDWHYVNDPVNDHYVPLLRLILYYMGRYSDPTYYGNAVLFYLADTAIVCALARVIDAHTGNFRVLAFTVLAYAIWPTFEGARYWFGGGFWLALPIAPFLAMVAVTRELLAGDEHLLRNYALLLFLGLLTVLSSSQILIPFIYLFAYSLPYLDVAGAARRRVLLGRLAAIGALTLAPTVLGFIGRRGLLKKAPDFSGLLDGSYFTNLALFVKAKVGFEKYSAALLVLLLLYFGGRALYRRYRSPASGQGTALLSLLFVIALCGLSSPKGAFTSATAPLWWASLLLLGLHALYVRLKSGPALRPAQAPAAAMGLCGLGMLMFFILQVGIGRRWGISTALADYYGQFALAGCWLLGAALIAFNLPATDAAMPRTWRRKLGTALAPLILLVVFGYSIHKYFPSAQYVAQVQAQKHFIRDAGLAACAEARRAGPAERLFIRARQTYTDCPQCGALLRGPQDFVASMAPGNTGEGGFMQFIARAYAEQSCPDLAGRLAVTRDAATRSTDGETPETEAFYRKYFQPRTAPAGS